MSITSTNIAALTAFLIGAMSAAAGVMVVIGKPMKYHVIDWLPVYNLILGLISAFFTSILICQGNQIGLPAAATTLAGHSIVLLILRTRYRDVAAKQSVGATLFRIIVWLLIIALMLV
ncbi:MAG: hypothetical protein OEV06_00910 [Anaerolineae bacterium]|nr:hypothetical protein [Anaerolineae bacterium]